MSWNKVFMCALLMALSSCGGEVKPFDAGPDKATDVTSSGGRMTGGNYTLDFQIGHSLDQGKATGGTVTLEGGAAVRP